MVHIVEGMRCGEGSIRLGATGKISALMTHELKTTKNVPKASVLYENRPQTVPVSIYCGVPRNRKIPSYRTSTGIGNRKRPINGDKERHKSRLSHAHRVSMLSSEDVCIDGTPVRDTNAKRRLGVVEIVDLKCGCNADKAWSNPISDKFRKLGFSRLS